MEGINILIAIAALGIAYWQLDLQRKEIRKNSQINSLIHMANMLKDKIDHHEKIIQNMKNKKEDWSVHASRVNNEFRPMLQKVNKELIDMIGVQGTALSKAELIQALKLRGESE